MNHHAPRTRLLLACGVLLLGASVSALFAQTPAPLKLAVVISIDGLSWEWLSHNRPWYESGLRRLLDEGHVEANARYRHINTETAPGHASLATGAPPRVTGVRLRPRDPGPGDVAAQLPAKLPLGAPAG